MPKQLNVSIDEALLEKVTTMLKQDKARVPYGALSYLVCRLLEQWLNQQGL